MLNLGLSAPWYTYRNKLASLFSGDTEVKVGELTAVTASSYKIDVTVDNAEKACALSQLIRSSIKLGKITVKVNVQVPNVVAGNEIDFNAAFDGNPNVHAIRQIPDLFGNVWTYVMFKKSNGVVQFYNDNLQDPYGNFVGLISDVAKEIFVEIASVSYSVDI